MSDARTSVFGNVKNGFTNFSYEKMLIIEASGWFR